MTRRNKKFTSPHGSFPVQNPNATIQVSRYDVMKDGEWVDRIHTRRGVLLDQLKRILTPGYSLVYVGTTFMKAGGVLSLADILAPGAHIGEPPSKAELEEKLLATNTMAGTW